MRSGICRFSSLSLKDRVGDKLLSHEFTDVCQSLGLPLKKTKANLKVSLTHSNLGKGDEAYTLEVSTDGIKIGASHYKGYFNALQTLRQLIVRDGKEFTIACCRIEDSPAFILRGFMLDVGRNYLPISLIKDMARRLSRYKINTLHLHLTDDPAWRIESDIYPALTDSIHHWKTRQPGKFYTKKELADLVKYCDSINIEVIPEVDMPGHSESFARALGFKMQSEQGLEAVKKLCDELIPLFPSPYFHVGSDEVRITMKNFMPDAISHIRSKGKEVIVWYPGYAPDSLALRMFWGKNEKAIKTDKSCRYIDSNGFYIDWVDSQSGVLQVFFQQPCEQPRGSDKALGSIMCSWTDAAIGPPEMILKQYPFYPCALTFAERIWRGRAQRQEEYMAKLPAKGTPEWDEFADFEQRLTAHRDIWFTDVPFAYVRQAEMQWRLIGPFDHKGVNDHAFDPEREIREEYTVDNDTLRWAKEISYGGAVHIRHLYSMFDMHRAKYRKGWPTVMSEAVGHGNGTCYGLTYITSPVDQDVYLMFGANGMWGHTGGYRTARAPEQGSWDFSGADIWLNDKRVDPPHWPFESLPWTGWGKGRIEVPLTQEGYFFRPPVKIHLKKGKNKILVRSVFGHWKGDDGERKWFFCCMPVHWDGSHYREVEGLSYTVE